MIAVSSVICPMLSQYKYQYPDPDPDHVDRPCVIWDVLKAITCDDIYHSSPASLSNIELHSNSQSILIPLL
jgi:hypothetical protein